MKIEEARHAGARSSPSSQNVVPGAIASQAAKTAGDGGRASVGGFQKLGPPFWGPCSKSPIVLASMLGSLIFGNYLLGASRRSDPEAGLPFGSAPDRGACDDQLGHELLKSGGHLERIVFFSEFVFKPLDWVQYTSKLFYSCHHPGLQLLEIIQAPHVYVGASGKSPPSSQAKAAGYCPTGRRRSLIPSRELQSIDVGFWIGIVMSWPLQASIYT